MNRKKTVEEELEGIADPRMREEYKLYLTNRKEWHRLQDMPCKHKLWLVETKDYRDWLCKLCYKHALTAIDCKFKNYF